MLTTTRAQELLSKSVALQKLNGLVGLKSVKKAVDSLLNTAIVNADKEEREEPPLMLNLNRCFLGNPGTGKTLVATLYAQILADFGLISRADVISTIPANLKGQYLGWTEKQVTALLKDARGAAGRPNFGSARDWGARTVSSGGWCCLRCRLDLRR